MVMHLEKPQVWDLLTTLEQSYEGEERGLMLRQTGNAYQLVTKPAFYTMLTALGRKKEVKLTNAAMETLAIVAFKQPVTRAEMEAIRGVKVDSVLNNLLDYGLIMEAGRKKALGNPILYGTTDKFLNVFGLASLEDLPSINEEPQDAIAAEKEALEQLNITDKEE